MLRGRLVLDSSLSFASGPSTGARADLEGGSRWILSRPRDGAGTMQQASRTSEPRGRLRVGEPGHLLSATHRDPDPGPVRPARSEQQQTTSSASNTRTGELRLLRRRAVAMQALSGFTVGSQASQSSGGMRTGSVESATRRRGRPTRRRRASRRRRWRARAVASATASSSASPTGSASPSVGPPPALAVLPDRHQQHGAAVLPEPRRGGDGRRGSRAR